MNPIRPPVVPYPGRAYSAESVPVPNPLYGMHINAAVAGPSTHRLPPRSNTSSDSFYPTPLSQQNRASQPPAPPLPSKPPALSSASAFLPSSLMPGGTGRPRPGLLSSFESSLLFQPSTVNTSSGSPSNTPALPKPRSYSEGINVYSSRPPIPPKPLIQTQTLAVTSRVDASTSAGGGSTGAAPQIPPKPFILPAQEKLDPTTHDIGSSDEDQLVAQALELSLKDSGPVGHSDAEDDILARVLEESMASISSTSTARDTRACRDSDSRQFEATVGFTTGSSLIASSSCESSTAAYSFNDTLATSATSWSGHGHGHAAAGDQNSPHALSSSASTDRDLEELLKREEERLRAEDEARRMQMEMDEELARSIARLEADSAQSTSTPSTPSAGAPSSVPPGLPNTVPRPSLNHATRPYSVHVASLSRPNSYASFNPLPPLPSSSKSHAFQTLDLARGHGSCRAAIPSDYVLPPYDGLSRSVSAQAAIPSIARPTNFGSPSSPGPSVPPMNTRPLTVTPVQNRPDSRAVESPALNGRPAFEIDTSMRMASSEPSIGPPPSKEAERDEADDNGESPVLSPISVEGSDEGRLVSRSGPSSPPIVEEELLLGVSFGFNAPPMSPSRDPMQGPIPNIITLPYGKCPPLHIQAPSWKHLLKLLTRLSDSRVEPTVEALAAAKSEMKLRTVIHFMKVHHESEDWRTIIYLTIDVPLPPSTFDASKYTNGDVNTLPYSYTMSPLPALLRAGAGDFKFSKCFTVPVTANTPYPTLPMTLPDLALYLLAVLDDSRQAASDSSGGLRKLAKMIDTLYPADAHGGVGPELDGPDKRGVSKFFRRLGRGNKESQSQRGGNAERFEFITPFRIDEYH